MKLTEEQRRAIARKGAQARMASRREFFQSLVAGGASVASRPDHRNRRAHHSSELIYHGPMRIPTLVAEIIAEHPAIKRTTHGHLTSRYSQGGWTWLFRCQIPEHRCMVGDIRRQPDGHMRVVCWSAANPDRCTHASGFDDPCTILARKEGTKAALQAYTQDFEEPGSLPPEQPAWQPGDPITEYMEESSK